MDGDDILYYTNEKNHPRKRLKGRKGCPGAKAKGSQRKFSKSDFHNTSRYYSREPKANTIVKFENEYHNEEECKEPLTFEDGNLRSSSGGSYWTRLEYSMNKKKRWELMENLKEKGYFSHLPNKTFDLQIKMDQESIERNEDLLDSKIITNELKKLKDKRTKKKSAKRKKKENKKKKEMERKREEFKRLFYLRNNFYHPQYHIFQRLRTELSVYDRKRSDENHERSQKANKLKDQLKTIQKKERRKKKREKKLKSHKVAHNTFEIERKRKEEDEETKERIRSNTDFYKFTLPDKNKWYRRPRDRKYDYRRDNERVSKKKRVDLKKEIQSSLTHKNKYLKV